MSKTEQQPTSATKTFLTTHKEGDRFRLEGHELILCQVAHNNFKMIQLPTRSKVTLMKNPFEIGDRVKAVNVEESVLKYGVVYEVINVRGKYIEVEGYLGSGFYVWRFELCETPDQQIKKKMKKVQRLLAEVNKLLGEVEEFHKNLLATPEKPE